MIKFCPIKIYFQNADPFNDTCYMPLRTDYSPELIDFLEDNHFECLNIRFINKFDAVFITNELKRYWICNFMSIKYCLIKGEISSNNFINQYPNIILEYNYSKDSEKQIGYLTEAYQISVKENFNLCPQQ